MCKLFIILSTVLLPTACFADGLYLTVGEGIKDTKDKYISVSYEKPIYKAILGGVAGSAMIFNNYFSGSTLYAGEAFIGVRIEIPAGLYLEALQGVAVISHIDNDLDSLYQFPTTLGLGLQRDQFTLGGFYKHYSNGSAKITNVGKDFVGMTFGFKF